MRTIKRTYPKACSHCNATGFVQPYQNPKFTTTSFTNACPVCNGAKVITVTETEYKSDSLYGPNPIDVNPYDVRAVRRNLNRIKAKRH